MPAAAYVDRWVAPFAHRVRPTALDRAIAAAIARHMPEEAHARQRAAGDGRRFEIDTRLHDLNGLCGTAEVCGTLDLADAPTSPAPAGSGTWTTSTCPSWSSRSAPGAAPLPRST